jgi:hypothetical protein
MNLKFFMNKKVVCFWLILASVLQLNAIAPWIISAVNILSAGVAYKIAVDPFLNKAIGGYKMPPLGDTREATVEERKLFLARYPSRHATKIYMTNELGLYGVGGCAFSDINTIYMDDEARLARARKAINTTNPNTIDTMHANRHINESLMVFDHEMGHIIDNLSAKLRFLGTTLATVTGALTCLSRAFFGPIQKSKIPLTRCMMRIPVASVLYLVYMGVGHAYARHAEYVADANIRPSLIPTAIGCTVFSSKSYTTAEEAFSTVIPLLKKYVPQSLSPVNKFCKKFLVIHDRAMRANKLRQRRDRLYMQNQQAERQMSSDCLTDIKKPIKAPTPHEWEDMDGYSIEVWQQIFEAEKQNYCTVKRQSKWVEAFNCVTQKLAQD